MFALLTLLAASTAATADIVPMLRQQGFDGPQNSREELDYVGHIRQGRNDYQVYVYRAVFRAAAVDHGTSRIIIVLNGSTYLGQYRVDDPGACRVRDQRVICDTGSPPRAFAFTRRGPPAEIWFDGYVVRFELGTWANGQ